MKKRLKGLLSLWLIVAMVTAMLPIPVSAHDSGIELPAQDETTETITLTSSSSDEVYTLKDDTTADIVIADDPDETEEKVGLCLNGHTLTGDITIKSGQTLTIYDERVAHGSGDDISYIFQGKVDGSITNNGTLNLEELSEDAIDMSRLSGSGALNFKSAIDLSGYTGKNTFKWTGSDDGSSCPVKIAGNIPSSVTIDVSKFDNSNTGKVQTGTNKNGKTIYVVSKTNDHRTNFSPANHLNSEDHMLSYNKNDGGKYAGTYSEPDLRPEDLGDGKKFYSPGPYGFNEKITLASFSPNYYPNDGKTYVFDGWLAAGGDQAIPPEQTTTTVYELFNEWGGDCSSGLIYLDAQWEPGATVTYDYNYDVADPKTETVGVKYDDPKAAEPTATHQVKKDPTRDDFRFLGWNTQQDGKGDTYPTKDKDSITVGPDGQILYAQWAEIFDVTVEQASNSTVTSDKETAITDETVTLTVTPPGDGYGLTALEVKPEDGDPITPTKTSEEGNTYTFTMPDSNVTVSASWALNSYTVTWNYNDGSTNPKTETSSVQYGTTITSLTPTDRTGYQFAGWYTSKDGETAYNFGTPVTSNLTLYAKWTPNTGTKYKVEYYLQDINSNSYTLDTTNSKELTGTTGEPVSATQRSITGFTFNKDDSTLSGEIKADGSLVLKLYYDRNSYKLTYQVTGDITHNDVEVPDEQSLKYGESFKEADPLKKEGYTFSGWNTSVKLEASEDEDKDYKMPASDVEFTGSWTPNKYTIRFDPGEGSGTMDNLTATYDKGIELPTAGTFTKEGYTFDGWTDGNNNYTNEQTVNNLTAVNNGTVTLTAKWKANTYTIQFDPGEGSGTMDNLTATYDKGIELPTAGTFTKEGYTFDGWKFGNEVYKSGDTVKNLTKENGGTVTLTAQWTANTVTTKYTVTFVSEWGDAPAEQTVTAGKFAVEPKPPASDSITTLDDGTIIMTLDNDTIYKFYGWYTSEDGGETLSEKPYDFKKTPVNGNLTLYAKWVRQYILDVIIEGQLDVEYDGVTAYLVALGSTDKIEVGEIAGPGVGNPEIYSFDRMVDAAQYNVVVTATDTKNDDQTVTVTALADLRNQDVKAKLELSLSTKNSFVRTSNDGVSPVLVGGVDEVANQQEIGSDVKSIEVRLTVDEKPTVDEKITQRIDEASGGQTIETYLDISLLLYTNYKDGSAESGPEDLGNGSYELDFLIDFSDFDTTGKKDLTVYRVYEGKDVTTLRMGKNNAGEYFEYDEETGILTIHTEKYSTCTIGIAYTSEGPYNITLDANGGTINDKSEDTVDTGTDGKLESLPDPDVREGYTFKGWYTSKNGGKKVTAEETVFKSDQTIYAHWEKKSTGGSSGGGGGTRYYTITVEDANNGLVESSHTKAPGGNKITLTVTPEASYELSALTVTDHRGQKAKLTDTGDGVYTFKMPDSDVTVTAAFDSEWDLGYRNCPRDYTCPIWPFTDAETTAWYHDGVHFCLENGIMAGYDNNLFKPDNGSSRAMITVMLWRLNGSPVVNYALNFADIADGKWYTEAIRWAKSEGVAEGYGNGYFGPDDQVTREQMVTILWRYAKYKGYDVSVGENTNLLSYGDALTIKEYAIPAMQWACGTGMVLGKQDGEDNMILDPKGSTTRAQMATMMMRFCAEIVK